MFERLGATKREKIAMLMVLVTNEIIFFDKGYGDDKPALVQMEYNLLQSTLRWLEQEVVALNEREFPLEKEPQ